MRERGKRKMPRGKAGQLATENSHVATGVAHRGMATTGNWEETRGFGGLDAARGQACCVGSLHGAAPALPPLSGPKNSDEETKGNVGKGGVRTTRAHVSREARWKPSDRAASRFRPAPEAARRTLGPKGFGPARATAPPPQRGAVNRGRWRVAAVRTLLADVVGVLPRDTATTRAPKRSRLVPAPKTKPSQADNVASQKAVIAHLRRRYSDAVGKPLQARMEIKEWRGRLAGPRTTDACGECDRLAYDAVADMHPLTRVTRLIDVTVGHSTTANQGERRRN
ncbi:hypothetical protein MTO96_011893 [Rhipicephalus appendiculatus]